MDPLDAVAVGGEPAGDLRLSDDRGGVGRHQDLGGEAAHGVQAVDPVAHGAGSAAADRVEVREGGVEVVPGQQHPLRGEPDEELVLGLAGRLEELEADPSDLERRLAGEGPGGHQHAGAERGVDVDLAAQGGAGELLEGDVASELAGAADRLDAAEDAVLVEEPVAETVGGPDRGVGVGPDVRAADVVDVAVGVDDGGGGARGGCGQGGVHRAGALGAEGDVDDDVAGVGADEHGVGEVVADGDEDVGGDLLDPRLADQLPAMALQVVGDRHRPGLADVDVDGGAGAPHDEEEGHRGGGEEQDRTDATGGHDTLLTSW